MKKICMFILSALLLCTACQPTPEVEFVVNKGDDTVEEKLAAVQDGTAGEGRQTFPDRWDEGPVTENDQLTLTARAEVIQKADGHYPVYRTRQHTVTQEEVVSLLEQLLPAPTSVTIPVDTKADWQQSYQEWLDDLMEQQAWVTAGKPQVGMDRDEAMMSAAEIDRISKEYQRLIAEAPEAAETTPVADFYGLKLNEGARVYELADGSKATVEAMAYSSFVSVDIFKGCSGSGYIYYEMPCWVVFFTWNDGQADLVDNPQVMQEALILNAVDGSIVHGEYGY